MDEMKIVVICGGLSMERDVSISSGTLICGALRKLGVRADRVHHGLGLRQVDPPVFERASREFARFGNARAEFKHARERPFGAEPPAVDVKFRDVFRRV